MHRIYLFMAVFFTISVGMRNAEAQEPVAFQTAKTPTGLQNKLRPAVRIGGYSLQLPAEFSVETPPADPPKGCEVHAWTGTPRANGTRLSLMCNFFGPPAVNSQSVTIDAFAKKMLAGIQRRNDDWKQTPPLIGTLNGMTSISYGWSGVSREYPGKRRSQGWIVILYGGKGFVELAAQDNGADAPERLHLTEAAVRTFKRVDASTHP
ncbi:MAG: hypothetical protein JWN14_2082 [Chthonomonadales bacterium]|nr:hypothetical protein [Chthonomonadales bacterium]